jgi:hypothetical protein
MERPPILATRERGIGLVGTPPGPLQIGDDDRI